MLNEHYTFMFQEFDTHLPCYINKFQYTCNYITSILYYRQLQLYIKLTVAFKSSCFPLVICGIWEYFEVFK